MEKSSADYLVDRVKKAAFQQGYSDATKSPWSNIGQIEKDLEQACADLIQALTTPPPAEVEDFPTVRDQFAMASLAAMDYEAWPMERLAFDAYRIADAMMAARKGGA